MEDWQSMSSVPCKWFYLREFFTAKVGFWASVAKPSAYVTPHGSQHSVQGLCDMRHTNILNLAILELHPNLDSFQCFTAFEEYSFIDVHNEFHLWSQNLTHKTYL